jgi:hypothetical protein
MSDGSDHEHRPRSWPTGALRLAFRLPVYLYRLGLGRLLGHRFLLLTHRGRRSGRVYQTALEVVRYEPSSREVVAASGWGEVRLVPQPRGSSRVGDPNRRRTVRPGAAVLDPGDSSLPTSAGTIEPWAFYGGEALATRRRQ